MQEETRRAIARAAPVRINGQARDAIYSYAEGRRRAGANASTDEMSTFAIGMTH